MSLFIVVPSSLSIAMLKHYTPAVKYIVREQSLLGANHAGIDATRASQLNHFIESLASYDRDVDDSSAALDKICEETTAVTQEQKRQIASAVSLHMQGISTIANGSVN